MAGLDSPLRSLVPHSVCRGDEFITPDLGVHTLWKDYVFWLDVRTAEERGAVRMPYAYALPLNRLPEVPFEPPKHSYIIPFSGSTYRTGVAWFWLKAMGYQRVFALPAPIESMLMQFDAGKLRRRGVPIGCCAPRNIEDFINKSKNEDIAMTTMNEVMKTLDFEYLGRGLHAVTDKDFLQLINDEDTLFLDVRTSEELAFSSYPWAKHIPLHLLPQRLSELPKDKLIVPFCSSVFRASIAWAWLKGKGFEQVKTLVISTENIATLVKPGSLYNSGVDLKHDGAVNPQPVQQCCAGR